MVDTGRVEAELWTEVLNSSEKKVKTSKVLLSLMKHISPSARLWFRTVYLVSLTIF